MQDLKELIMSKNLLKELRSLEDEGLFRYFKELGKLDFYLNRYGMKTKHKFTVLNHTKKLLKNFDLALTYKRKPAVYRSELRNSSMYKKDFFRRVITLLDELNLVPNSTDFRVIVIVLLLHDVGKFTYDLSDEEIKQKSKDSRKGGKNISMEFLKLYYRTKGHEGRGAFIAFSKLEEAGIKQSFANRVKNLIIRHGDFDILQEDKEFNFQQFLRNVMQSATTYNYPMIRQEKPNKVLVRELNINYLVYLIDVFSVDDTGELWYSIKDDRELVYVKAKWLLGRRTSDLIDSVACIFYDKWDINKQKTVEYILRKNFLQTLRGNTSFSFDIDFDGVLSELEKGELLNFLKSYFELTDKMYPFYLNNTKIDAKILHINLLKEASGDFAFHFKRIGPDLVEIHCVKAKAYEGTLLRLLKAVISSSIELSRTIKIIKLLAHSGDNDRLIDIVTIRHRDEEEITDETLKTISKHIELCQKPGYLEKLDLPITQEDLQNRIERLLIELNDVEIGTRKFQQLRIITPVLSNLTIYSCLQVLAYINIINVRVEEIEDYYNYFFLVGKLSKNKYKISSASSFRKDLIAELAKNVVIES